MSDSPLAIIEMQEGKKKPSTLKSKVPKPIKKTFTDLRRIGTAIEPMEQFYFLRPDAAEVHGLQDWTAEGWTENLRAHPALAKQFVADLLGATAGNNP